MPSSFLQKVKNDNVEIHARSVFMQGLILMGAANIPAHLKGLQSLIEGLEEEQKAQSLNLLELAFLFILQQQEIGSLVIGAQNAGQFVEINQAYLFAKEKKEDVYINWTDYACNDRVLVTPSCWQELKEGA